MIVTHNVTIDLSDRATVPQIDAMQDDQYTRDLAISLMSGEAQWIVPEDAAVVIRYCKSDGVGGEYDTLPDGTSAWKAEGNVLTLALAPQVLTVPGTVALSATLIREEEILSIFAVHILVRHRVQGGITESQHYRNVMGFLPGPVNARTGQYLRVAQVDENGCVVAVEGADGAPDSGSGTETSGDVIRTLTISYGLTENDTLPPDDWVDYIPQMSAEYPCLWIKIEKRYTNGVAVADVGVVGYYSGVSSGTEPGEDDLPRVYFTGVMPTSKDQGELQVKIRYVSGTLDFSYPATLKVQGSSSVNYPKKNFTLKLYQDETYESKAKLEFRNWGKLNKFVLKAHWIDHSHVRNVGTAKIWGKIVASRDDYDSLPQELKSSPNNGATDGFTVKVFANGVYQGLYEWIVPKDKLFGQDSSNANHSILGSEWNNQPSCAFSTTAPVLAGNWSEELQDSMSDGISESFTNLIRFVAGSTDEEFVASAESYFDVQSVIDYCIFARVFCIVDNLCRNQIFFTYDGTRWYEGVWDLDAVLGLPPTARGFFPSTTEFQTGYIAELDYGMTNLLYQRVETLFRDRFCARYAKLRAGVLAMENILEVYERLTDVITTHDGLLQEDYASTTGDGKFTGIPYTGQSNIQQIRNFLAQRIPYMDGVIEEMGSVVPSSGISLSESELIFTGGGSQTLTATILPEGCTEEVQWESSNASAVQVVDGVVTAVANGTAVITVTCGGYSASCTVTVSGMEEAVPCTGITLDQTVLNFSEAGSRTLTATVVPENTTDPIVWSSSNETVATVENGNVTALKNGSTVITASCGSCSAECSVSVEGLLPYVRSFEESSWTNGYIDNDGTYSEKNVNAGDMNLSDYIQLQPSADVYTVSDVRFTVPYDRISYYDSELNWIANKYSQAAATLCVQPAPEEAVCYVISCMANGNKDAVSVTRTEYTYPENNLLDGLTWEPGTFIIANGYIAGDAGVVCSSAFDISMFAGADIRLTADITMKDALRITFWNAEGGYISGAYGADTVHCMVPDNAATARIAVPEAAYAQLKLGTRAVGSVMA